MAVDGVTNCTGDLTIARQRTRIAKGLVRLRHRIHLRDAQPEVLKIVGLRAQRETVEVLRSCEKLLAFSARVERSRTSPLSTNLHCPQPNQSAHKVQSSTLHALTLNLSLDSCPSEPSSTSISLFTPSPRYLCNSPPIYYCTSLLPSTEWTTSSTASRRRRRIPNRKHLQSRTTEARTRFNIEGEWSRPDRTRE